MPVFLAEAVELHDVRVQEPLERFDLLLESFAKAGIVGEVAGEIRRLLAEGLLVVLFPEGTSSGGREILPFKSSLLEPAVGLDSPLFATCVGYSLANGVVSEDVCYWGDMTLLPHFVKLLKKPFVQARVSFGEIRQPAADRKTLAKQLHTEVVRLKSLSSG